MEPSGGPGPAPDTSRPSSSSNSSSRDRQLVVRTASVQAPQQQQKPNLSLNLQTHEQHQQHHPSTASSPALTASAPASASNTNNNNATSSTSPALAATATAFSATTQAATAFSGTAIGPQLHHRSQQHGHFPSLSHQLQTHSQNSSSSSSASGATSALLAGIAHSSSSTAIGGAGHQPQQHQQTIEKLSRPMAFDKMESLVREMQDPENGVPVRQQKMFLTSIPYAFMGYDLIEWLMDRLLIEESEALNIANQLCLHGYFFPVNDSKTLTVKDDSSLYRFQTPYYWPWQHKAPDNVEYAIYLAKRSLRNKQRHALEDYEAEALASLHKNLKGKWDFISMQAEEQVRLAKERKKGDKIVGDSQERAYWRVHRPPPGQFTPLEPCPIPSRDRQGSKPNKKKTIDDAQREVDYLNKSLNRTRMKMSQACESLVNYSETFAEYDFFLQPVLPSNPWVTEDITFWQLNNTFVDIPTEKRVKRWAISIEELVCDPTGLQEFTAFLEKEYSHENIRFWIAVNRLRRSAHSQVPRKVQEIYEEFLKPGAPCEINIDGKTMESVLKGLKNPSRFTFDAASEHIYTLLLKKDCYPRFIRSDHYKRLLETGIQPSHKKRFFNFGGVSGAKKKMTAALSSQPNLGEVSTTSSKGAANMSVAMMQAPPPGSLARRRGSDRSLTGSAHELAVIGVNKDPQTKVPHSHSQSNLSEIPYSGDAIYRGDMPQRHQQHHQSQHGTASRDATYGNGNGKRYDAVVRMTDQMTIRYHQEPPKPKSARLESTAESAVCPWDMRDEPPTTQAPTPAQTTVSKVKLNVCPWKQEDKLDSFAVSVPLRTTNFPEIADVSSHLQRNLGIRHQNTVDSGEAGMKRLIPNFTEQRRASVSFTPGRPLEYQGNMERPSSSQQKISSTPSPTVGSQNITSTTTSTTASTSSFPPVFTPIQSAAGSGQSSQSSVITRDPPSSSDAEIDEELNKLSISDRNNSESSASELPAPSPSPPKISMTSPPPDTKVTSPPPIPPPPVDIESVETQTVDEDVSPQGESPRMPTLRVDSAASGGGGSAASGGESDAEVEVIVEEVQIELIEADGCEDLKCPKRTSTPTIHVQDDDSCQATPMSPKSPKFRLPKISRSPEESVESQKSISLSPRQSPDRELSHRSPSPIALDAVTGPMTYPTGDSSPASPATTVVSTIPPPLPPIGPMEEEKLLAEESACAAAAQDQEELSPTTDEYQEGLRFGSEDIDDDRNAGYIPPAPTPAPSLAPLAELEDTIDDELCSIQEIEMEAEMALPASRAPPAIPAQAPIVLETHVHVGSGGHHEESTKKRRKKRNSESKKTGSMEEKEQAGTSAGAAGGGVTGSAAKGNAETDRNTVCPWEDESVTTSDGTFVKTYATLGYL